MITQTLDEAIFAKQEKLKSIVAHRVRWIKLSKQKKCMECISRFNTEYLVYSMKTVECPVCGKDLLDFQDYRVLKRFDRKIVKAREDEHLHEF